MFNIQEELKKLPTKPGVYIMKDENDEIIYVGKAKVLKNRVRQYFQKNYENEGGYSVKVRRMVENISSFEYIVTNSEVEALILENNLIKQHKPKYNILLKDDKTYPYIKITTNEPFPRVFITRKHTKDKARYFGPYTSAMAVKETLELVNKIWRIRRCLKKLPRDIGKERPCLNYHIGNCLAPCNGFIDSEKYNEMIGEIIDFLSGNTGAVLKSLEERMKEHSENMEFERAGEIRDLIYAVKKLEQKQIIENMKENDRDIFGYMADENDAVVQVFFVRGGKIVGREHYFIEDIGQLSQSEVTTDIVKQFYSGTPFIPKEIILDCDIEDFELISSWLSEQKGQRVNILVPQKGERKRLVELANKNAAITLERLSDRLKKEKERTIGALDEIRAALGLEKSFSRIESYDISNTQGYESVGSMIVFQDGKPKKSDYRKFRIKGVIGANDYLSLKEVLERRFLRYKNESDNSFEKLPDAIFIDGGKGQMGVVEAVLDELEIGGVIVCGMVKDDHHRTRGLILGDNEIPLDSHSEGFKLITRIQDEVHRFAIEYHRSLRDAKNLHSVLDDIKGIGGVRRKALLKHFGDIEAIKNAGVEELSEVEGMNKKSAEAVFEFFNN